MLSASPDPFRAIVISGHAYTLQKYCLTQLDLAEKKSTTELTFATALNTIKDNLAKELNYLIQSVKDRFEIDPVEIITIVRLSTTSNSSFSLLSLIIKYHWNDLLDQYLEGKAEDIIELTTKDEIYAAQEHNFHAFEKIGNILKNKRIPRQLSPLLQSTLQKTAEKKYLPEQEKIMHHLLRETEYYPVNESMSFVPDFHYCSLLYSLSNINDDFIFRILEPKTTFSAQLIPHNAQPSEEIKAEATEEKFVHSSQAEPSTLINPRQLSHLELWAHTLMREDSYYSQLDFTVHYIYEGILINAINALTRQNADRTFRLINCFIRMFPFPLVYLDHLLLLAIKRNAITVCPKLVQFLKEKGAAISLLRLDNALHGVLNSLHMNKNTKETIQALLKAGAKINRNSHKGTAFLTQFQRGFRDDNLDILQMVLGEQGQTFQTSQLDTALLNILKNAHESYLFVNKKISFPEPLAFKIAILITAGANPKIQFFDSRAGMDKTSLLQFLNKYNAPADLIELCNTKLAQNSSVKDIPLSSAKYFMPDRAAMTVRENAEELEEKISTLILDEQSPFSEDNRSPLFIINIQSNLLAEISNLTLRATLNWLIRLDISLQLIQPKANFFYTETFLSKLREAVQDYLGLMCDPSEMPLCHLLTSKAPESVILAGAELLLESSGQTQLTYLSNLHSFRSFKARLTMNISTWLAFQQKNRPDDLLDFANNINGLLITKIKSSEQHELFDELKTTYSNLAHHFNKIIDFAKAENASSEKFTRWIVDTDISHTIEARFFKPLKKSIENKTVKREELLKQHQRCYKRHENFIQAVQDEMNAEISRLRV